MAELEEYYHFLDNRLSITSKASQSVIVIVTTTAVSRNSVSIRIALRLVNLLFYSCQLTGDTDDNVDVNGSRNH